MSWYFDTFAFLFTYKIQSFRISRILITWIYQAGSKGYFLGVGTLRVSLVTSAWSEEIPPLDPCNLRAFKCCFFFIFYRERKILCFPRTRNGVKRCFMFGWNSIPFHHKMGYQRNTGEGDNSKVTHRQNSQQLCCIILFMVQHSHQIITKSLAGIPLETLNHPHALELIILIVELWKF